jgi:cytoskeletal protein RodZ
MERQRNQAALEQQRLAHEMDLRRAEVAKKRPTWMLVVTGFALVAAVGLIFFALWSKHNSDEAAAKQEKAEQIAKQAVQEAKEAQDRVDQLDRDMKDQNERLAAADTAVKSAQTDADRKAALSNLDKLRQQKFEMEQRIAAAKSAAAKAERAKGVHLSKECLENPLAKGCS